MLRFQKNLILAILFSLPAYLIKIRVGWISFNVLELLVAILVLAWILNRNNKYSILDTQYSMPVALIFFGLFSSIFFNEGYYAGLGVVKGWFFFPALFAAVFFDQLKRDEALLEKSLAALFFSGVLVSAAGTAFEFFGFLTFDHRLKIFWDSPNQAAMFLAAPFLIGAFLALKEKNIRKKIVYFVGLFLIALNLYFTFSFGACLGIGAALAVFFCSWLGQIRQKKYFVIALGLAVFVLGAASVGKYESLRGLGERSSLASRFMIWKSAGLMIEKNPFLGIGPGNFQEKYLEYQKYFLPYLEWSVPQPHNIFLAFWLESGAFGLIGFVWTLALFFKDNKKTIEKNRPFGILFLAIMIYILVHGMVDTTYWRNDLAFVFWAIVAANLFLSKKTLESVE
jgi:O-antigen ligase